MKTNTGNGTTGADTGVMKSAGTVCDVATGARGASIPPAGGYPLKQKESSHNINKYAYKSLEYRDIPAASALTGEAASEAQHAPSNHSRPADTERTAGTFAAAAPRNRPARVSSSTSSPAASSQAAGSRRRLTRAAALLAASSALCTVLAVSAVMPTAAYAEDLKGAAGTTNPSKTVSYPNGFPITGGYGNGWGGIGTYCSPCGSGPSFGKGGNGSNGSGGAYGQGGAGGGVGAITVTPGVTTISGQNGAGGQIGVSQGAWGIGGGGGGGGAGLYLDHQTASTYSGLTITGGAGGRGGNGTAVNYQTSQGGPGGGGGAGVVVNGGSFTNVAGATIVGGNGGGGGTATGGTEGVFQGTAGAGGDAVVVQDGATFINEGTVTGGNGANDGNGGPLSNSGAGIRVGDNGYVINSGTVSSGAPSGTAPSNAIEIVGNNGTLEIRDGSNIQGKATVATGTTNNTLALGGTTDSTLDASEIGSKYVGFQNYQKTGDSKWNLTGATTEVTPWNINGGTLSVETDASLGDKTGKATVDGGTLEFAGTTTSERNLTMGVNGGTLSATGGQTATVNGVIDGPGAMTINGPGTINLRGANTYEGGTEIKKGGIANVIDDGNLGKAGSSVAIDDGGTLQTAGSFNTDRNVTLTGGTGTVDTQGNTNVINGVVSGPGGLTKTGTGTLELTKKGTYTGETNVNDGILKLTGDGDLSSSEVNIGDKGTVDVSGTTSTETYVKGVTGDGKLERGDKNLHITDGDGSTYTGDLGGSGKVYIEGGKQGLGGNQTYTGDTIVTAGSELALVNGNLVNSSVTVDGLLSGSGSMKNLINNAGGNVDPGTADSFGTLTVTGDYTGNGGTLTLHEKLEGDATEGDRFVVNGNTSGKTGVVVINRGGNGAATTQGVQVITVNGKSEGTFDLAKGDQQTTDGRWAVIAGAYAYTLDPNGKGFALNSQLASDLNRPNPGPGPNPGPHRYSAGVPLYSGSSQMLGVLNRSSLTSLSERTGNRYWSGAGAHQIAQGDGPGSGAEAAPAPEAAGSLIDAGVMWGRIDAAHGRYDLSGSATGNRMDVNRFTMQAGIDGQFYEDAAGKVIGSAWVNYSRAKADISSLFGDGTLEADGYGVGGALTWYGENGFYLDGQGQVTWYRTDFDSDLAHRRVADGVKGLGYGLSLEGGQRVAIDQQWSVTPQAQLSWSSLDLDGFADAFGAQVRNDRDNSLTGRIGLGVNYETTWQDAEGYTTRLDVGGIANVYRELLDDARHIDVSGVKIAAGRNDRTWGELGLTTTYTWHDGQYGVFGKVSTATGLEKFGDSYNVSGNVGFRVKW